MLTNKKLCISPETSSFLGGAKQTALKPGQEQKLPMVPNNIT